mgnify:CR=1 FL=1|jgi:hypothetical protein
MALDPNIALGVRPLELPNPLAQYGQLAQIQNAQNQNALAQFQLGSAQRAEKSQNLLADAYAQSTDPATGKIDYNKLTSLVASGGGGAQIPAIQKSRFEQESAGTKLLADKLALLPEAYKRADTPEAYLALHQSVHADPILGPWLKSTGATPEKGLAALQNAVQTGKFDDLRMGSMQSVSQLLEGMKPISVAAGSSVYDPRSKSFTQAPAAPERTDTDLIRNFNAAKAQGFTGTIFDYERKIKEAGRTPAQAAAPTVTTIVDPTNPNQMITIDARRYQGGGANSPGVIGVAGKEPSAALRTNKTEAGKTQLADDLDNLRASFETLDKMRSIPSTERNVLSNVASGIAATGVGQKAGQLFGTEAQVERDVINSARSRLVNSIKNATGMSAQQLNSNVELQTMLKSISDPGQSVQAALRIIEDIENAYVKGDGMLPKRNKPDAAAQGTGGFKYLGKESK